MNMAQAKNRLMEIANGKYHALEYKIDDHGNGNVSQRCKVYLSGPGYFEAEQWDACIAQLESALSGQPKISEDLPLSQPKTE